MANFGQLVLTNLGIQEQYKAQSGGQLKFKRIGMGSGTYTGNITALKKLVSENVSVDISKGYMQNNAYMVEGFFSNESLQTGFAWREIGLFVEDEYGNEVLYCYANAGNTYDYIPATADERYSKYIRIATAIGNATNISIVESENFIGVDVKTFNATVEELQTEIDHLHPSKEVNGSVIAIDDSANQPFVGMNIYGKSEQITTNGYQLFNHNATELATISKGGATITNNGDGSFTISGSGALTSDVSAYHYYTHEQTVKMFRAGTLRFKDIANTTPRMYVHPQRNGGNLSTLSVSNMEFEITQEMLDDETFRIVIGVYGASGNSIVAGTIKPMLYQDGDGTHETFSNGVASPSPDYPQEIASVGNSGTITSIICGKNVLPNNGASQTLNGVTFTKNADGSISVSGTATERTTYIYTYIIRAKIGEKYRLTGCPSGGSLTTYTLRVYNVRGDLTTFDDNGSGIEFEYTNTTGIFNSAIIVNAGITMNATFYPMVCLASETDTEYEPYKEQSIFITSPNGLAGIPVSSGGNYTDANGQQWICDEIDLARGVFIKRTNTADLGELAWSYSQDYEVFTTYIDDIFPNTLDLISTHYITSTLNSATSPDLTIYGRKSGDLGGLGIKNSNYTDAATFKDAMSGAIVLYKLKEPIEEPLTDEQIAAYKALTSYNPNTTILNDAGADIKVEYVTKAFDGIMSLVAKGEDFDKLATENMENLVIQTIGTSQTWSAPKAVGQLFKVFCVGGGGGGGGFDNNNVTTHAGGGGGGGGHIEIATLKIEQGTVIDIVCGAGGAGSPGATSPSDGESGGDTFFGELLTAAGGEGGEACSQRSYHDGYGGKGGNGGAGGGGGAGGVMGVSYPSVGGNGGNGSLCGGGGAGSSQSANDEKAEMATKGTGGVYGGEGGSSSSASRAPKLFIGRVVDILFQLDKLNVSLENMRSSGMTDKAKGYGSGGVGGAGGLNDTSTYSDLGTVVESCGGGGGYCGNGGDGGSSGGGGGGGGYCGNGGKGSIGGGGGGGFFCNGGNGNTGGGGGGGFFFGGAGGTGSGTGNGGTGGVLIMYIEEA